jgi:hemolysin D
MTNAAVKVKRRREDQAFLPAALEILETPASPVRMAMIWFICVLATACLAWSWFGTIDIVATAQGKIQPVGRVKIIQSLVSGRIATEPLANGTPVAAGAVLVQLDDTETRAEWERINGTLLALNAEIDRRNATVEAVSNWRLENLPQAIPGPEALSLAPAVPASIRLREQRQFQADLSQLQAGLLNLSARLAQQEVEVARFEQTLAAQTSLLGTIAERLDMRTALADLDVSSRATVIDALETHQQQLATLTDFEGQLKLARAALPVTRSEVQQLVDSFIADHVAKLADAQRQADELEQQQIQAAQRLAQTRIISPIAGIVQASALTTSGQVVDPGTELMRIVPDTGGLEIEAYLPNREIGFVHMGDPAVIKVEAFPFTDYGLIHGSVARIANDAVPEADAQQLEQGARPSQSGIPLGNVQRVQNLVFPVTIVPDRSAILVGNAELPLTPGMTVTVEITTGQRRIIQYLFSPLAEIASQAMHER